jgi:hypothetical protein
MINGFENPVQELRQAPECAKPINSPLLKIGSSMTISKQIIQNLQNRLPSKRPQQRIDINMESTISGLIHARIYVPIRICWL